MMNISILTVLLTAFFISVFGSNLPRRDTELPVNSDDDYTILDAEIDHEIRAVRSKYYALELADIFTTVDPAVFIRNYGDHEPPRLLISNLLQGGADVGLFIIFTKRILMRAIRNRDADLLQQIIANCRYLRDTLDLDVDNIFGEYADGRTAVHEAVLAGDLSALEAILEYTGTKFIESRDYHDMTPRDYALVLESSDAIRILSRYTLPYD